MTTNALMTETLPTIIGAGVVSRTTDTMFGRGRGRVKTRAGHKLTTRRFKGRVVHKGSRGGKYIIRHGRKVYL